MAKIKKRKVPNRAVVVDTNILWHKDKAVVVDPEFEEFWCLYADESKLELIIPSVVRGELLYQQTTSALKSLDRANEALAKAGAVAGKSYGHRVSHARVKNDVMGKFDDWIRRFHARVVEAPISTIKWDEILDASIWRIPPFVEDEKNPVEEKGFRDSMILETVYEYCANADSNIEIGFVCNDNMLRKTATKRMASMKNVSQYESIEDYASYLRLSMEQLQETFVQSIRHRANKKFYNRRDPSCLYFSDNVVEKIRETYASELQPPTGTVAGIGIAISSEGNWTAEGKETRWIMNAQFERRKGDRTYHWISRVSFVQMFKLPSKSPHTILDGNVGYLRVVSFQVRWIADVKSDGRFYNVTLNEIEFVNKSFAPPTNDELRKYNLDSDETNTD